MKILALSDTHGMHKSVEKQFPDFFNRSDIDTIIHAGDISSTGSEYQIRDFLDWFSNLHQFTYKIFIAGNHDIGFEDEGDYCRKLVPDNVIYLEDDGVEIWGIKFWGSPVTPPFRHWAFMREPHRIIKHWDAIPDDTDILITHGPPKHIGDYVLNRYGEGSFGCPELVDTIHRVNPDYHIFGHIHEGYGKYQLFDTWCFNVSSLNGRYKCTNDPVILKI